MWMWKQPSKLCRNHPQTYGFHYYVIKIDNLSVAKHLPTQLLRSPEECSNLTHGKTPPKRLDWIQNICGNHSMEKQLHKRFWTSTTMVVVEESEETYHPHMRENLGCHPQDFARSIYFKACATWGILKLCNQQVMRCWCPNSSTPQYGDPPPLLPRSSQPHPTSIRTL